MFMSVTAMSMMFLYDTVFFLAVYVTAYKGIDLFFTDYSHSLKILFDIDADRFGYNKELDTHRKHVNLFWTSAPVTFVILSLAPVINTVVYILFFSMVSATDINRVLYYIILLKLSIRFNILECRFGRGFRPHENARDLMLLCQLAITVVNYNDANEALQSVFQLLDELTGLTGTVLSELLETHTSLFKGDTVVSERLMSIKVASVATERAQHLVKFGAMASIFLFTVVSDAPSAATLTSPSDVTFCYYAGARLVQIYNYDLKTKRN